MAFVALHAYRSWPQISDLLLDADGDDQMRLVEVRDWLAGQSWFDTRQYRILPPEGISMHWSRYLDAGIAAILLAAATVLPMAQAELAAVIFWPSFLACLMVLILAHGTNRLLGPASALGALAVFLSWGKLGGEFVAPRIDHHNAQILCTTALFYLSLVPGRARLLGALAGISTACALAIGLEMLPTLATIWGLVALRHAFGEPKSGDWLMCFGIAITIAAPLLMAGQTPASDWALPYCDVLAPPVLALGAVGVVATLVPVLAQRVLTGPVARLLVMVSIATVGLWLAYPLFGRCVAGPYSDVPQHVRAIIESNVTEALSASILLRAQPELLARILAPPVIIALLAMATALRLRDRLGPVQRRALVQAFLIVGIGLVFATVQIRAANLMTPAVPFLGGFLVYAFTLIPRESFLRIPAVVVLVLAMPTSVERAATFLLRPAAMPFEVGHKAIAAAPDAGCYSASAMAEIATLPKSLVFTTLNLGPAILAYTPHSVTSAGYHRSSAAYWNGIGAFESEATLQAALARSEADYLVICTDGALESTSPLLVALQSRALPAWLSDATEGRKRVRVFQVEKAALAVSGGAP